MLIEQCESESISDFNEPFFQTQLQEDDFINEKVSFLFEICLENLSWFFFGIFKKNFLLCTVTSHIFTHL